MISSLPWIVPVVSQENPELEMLHAQSQQVGSVSSPEDPSPSEQEATPIADAQPMQVTTASADNFIIPSSATQRILAYT